VGMTRQELRDILNARDPLDFVESQILSRIPWIFSSGATYQSWLQSVATELAIGAENIRIVGSAATGFSLSPLKPGRPFRKISGPDMRASDIDIALIDRDLFIGAWNTVVQFDRLHSLHVPMETRDRIRFNVYWGLVDQKSLPRNTAPSRQLLTAMAVAGRSPPLRGHFVRCRIYRRIDDLRAYHVVSLGQLRAKLMEITNG